MYVDNTIVRGTITDLEIVESDWLKNVELTARNSKVRNASKSGHLNCGPNPPPNLLCPNQDGTQVPLT